MPKALIAGCTGQDGTYLYRLAVERGYEVLGFGRERVCSTAGWTGAAPDFRKWEDARSLVAEFQPDEVYYLSALHHSSEDSAAGDRELIEGSLAINTLALNHALAAIASECPRARLFYAASSRVFGVPAATPQDESTPLNPVCAYGISKAAGIQLCRYYRARRGIFASAGIFYNHESPLRSDRFISKKIVAAAVRIARGSEERLVVGDLDARVDWGYAPDYVDAALRILRLDAPGDFVIGTGEMHSVREWAEAAFAAAGLDWREHVREERGVLTRVSSSVPLRANSEKLRRLTGWRPSVSFEVMVKNMAEAELAHAR